MAHGLSREVYTLARTTLSLSEITSLRPSYILYLPQHAWYNDGIDERLYQGTAKAAEGIATSKAFSLAKEDSCEQIQSPDFRDSGIYGKKY